MSWKLTEILQQLEEAGLPESDFTVPYEFKWFNEKLGISFFLNIYSELFIISNDDDDDYAIEEKFKNLPEAIEKLKEVLK